MKTSNPIFFHISFLLLTVILFVGGCNIFEYSPFETVISNGNSNLNEHHITELSSISPAQSDSFTFAFVTDTHGHYDDFLGAVRDINKNEDILFTLHGGDLTDYGIQKEFEIAADIIAESRKPFITAIGNHDHLSNGRKIFKSMFGNHFYSFVFTLPETQKRFKFIIIDDNTLEYDFGEGEEELLKKWFENELADAGLYSGIFVVAHVPPWNKHYFHAENEEYYRSMLEEHNVIMSINGHEHRYYYGERYNDGVLYLCGDDIWDRTYSTITVHCDENISVSVKREYY